MGEKKKSVVSFWKSISDGPASAGVVASPPPIHSFLSRMDGSKENPRVDRVEAPRGCTRAPTSPATDLSRRCVVPDLTRPPPPPHSSNPAAFGFGSGFFAVRLAPSSASKCSPVDKNGSSPEISRFYFGDPDGRPGSPHPVDWTAMRACSTLAVAARAVFTGSCGIPD